jgi:hypothetical protein
MNLKVKIVATVTVLLLAFSTVEAAKKQRQWQTGKVLDSDGYSQYVGTQITDDGIFGVGARANYIGIHTYVIQIGQYVYIAKQPLRWRWSKYVSLVVNDPVTVAIENGKMYIPFANGKEMEAVVVKTIHKEH